MSAGSGVKGWLATRAFRHLSAPDLNLSIHPQVTWAAKDWSSHLGLYGPTDAVSAVQANLGEQFLALGLPVFLIGAAPDASAEHSPLYHPLRAQGASPLILGRESPELIAMRVSAAGVTRWGSPVRAAALLSPGVSVAFSRVLAHELTARGVACLFALDAHDPHRLPGLIFGQPYGTALLWPGYVRAYAELTTRPVPDVSELHFVVLRPHLPPLSFCRPSPA